MKKIIDIHSHILPGVDDGCGSKEEALEMIKIYEEQNVEAVICTPHFGPCGITGADVEAAFNWLTSTGSNVKLYLGNEILFTLNTMFAVKFGLARRMNNSRYILVEFDDWLYHSSAGEIVAGLKILSKSKYEIILAHPERYTSLQNNLDYYDMITKLGVKLQVNAYDIVKNKNQQTVIASRYILNNKLASFIGSDAHGAERRRPELKDGVKWIYDHCPEDYADAVVHDNAKKIIGGA